MLVPSRRFPFLAAVVVLLAPLVYATEAASAPLTIDDIESLLKAGLGDRVILKQIEATGTRLTLTVEGLLRLKAAGASDALLEALLQPGDAAPAGDGPAARQAGGRGGAPPAAPEEAPHIRIYTTENERGETVVHITNLDAAGRRLGGELSESERARRNVVESPDPPTAPAYPDHEVPAYEPPPPVTVNIYPPAPPEPTFAGESTLYGSGYPGGLYPGFLAAGFHGFVPSHHRHLVRPHRSHFYPPGSYTHYLRYHHTGITPDRPAVLHVDPYTWGNARARNRDAFRRR